MTCDHKKDRHAYFIRRDPSELGVKLFVAGCTMLDQVKFAGRAEVVNLRGGSRGFTELFLRLQTLF
jgi:hypothetical protein